MKFPMFKKNDNSVSARLTKLEKRTSVLEKKAVEQNELTRIVAGVIVVHVAAITTTIIKNNLFRVPFLNRRKPVAQPASINPQTDSQQS